MLVKIANFFAKYSCPMWCSTGLIRRPCRKVYRWLAESPAQYRRAMRRLGFSAEMLTRAYEQPFNVDTYPPLYADPSFAPWPEVADPEDPRQYNLISSSDGQVIRYATSYCAWKIFELTGRHLARNLPGRFDAKDWVKYLAQAGYATVVDRPHSGHHYVGIIPGYGEFGLVVWFGQMGKVDEIARARNVPPSQWYWTGSYRRLCSVTPAGDHDPNAVYCCSTYEKSCFQVKYIEQNDRRVIWVQID